jgi:GrpB-like predicted nucleotidyltransferase (UPF0157 family)
MREPASEDYLRTHTVGKLTPLSGPICIADYDPNWPHTFEREASRIQSALGDHAMRIEHTRSTSVPGLPAKPIIDIVLAVADSAAEAEYVPALARAGYQLRIREPDWYQHRMLAFRDWLRINAADRDLYARCKRELAQQNWNYTQNYADAKAAVIEEIVSRARSSATPNS